MDLFRAQDAAAKASIKAGLRAQGAKTLDGYDNFMSRVGLNNDNVLSAATYTFDLITRNRVLLESAYRGSWITGRVIDSWADDMTRAGVTVTTSDKKSDLRELYNNARRLKIWQSLNANVKWGRLYGGSLAIIQIAGQSLASPLRLETVGKGQFKGLVVFDRWMLNPSSTHFIQEGPDMGLPEYYSIVSNPTGLSPTAPTATGQVLIHHSRVIRYTGIDLPYFQAITEMMWGESVIERLWDRLILFDNASLSSGQLVDRANLRTVSIDGLREVIAAGGEAYDALIQHFEMMRLMQVNEGLTLLDKEDLFTANAYSFAGLSDMMLQFAQQISGATGTPLIVLFSQSPAGLGATGETDLRIYYDAINAHQEVKLRNPVETVLKLLYQSTFGRPAPDDLEFSFNPLWQLPATDKATVAKTNTDTVIAAHQEGLCPTGTAMKELRTMSGDTGLFSGITDEDIEEAELEPPPMPDGMGDPNAMENPDALEGGKPVKLLPNGKPVRDIDAKVTDEANFKESDHPRKDDGKFGKGSGSPAVAEGKKKDLGSASQPLSELETEQAKEFKIDPASPDARTTLKTASSVYAYTKGNFEKFLEADRSGKADEDNDRLNSYLEKADKHQGDIYRGMAIDKEKLEGFLESFAAGKTIELPAKSSFSQDEGQATSRIEDFKGDTTPVLLKVPNSKSGVDISSWSNAPSEKEVLVPKGSKYRVKSVEKGKNGITITLEDIVSDSKPDISGPMGKPTGGGDDDDLESVHAQMKKADKEAKRAKSRADTAPDRADRNSASLNQANEKVKAYNALAKKYNALLDKAGK